MQLTLCSTLSCQVKNTNGELICVSTQGGIRIKRKGF